MSKKKNKHPMQPVYFNELTGTPQFKENAIVKWMLDTGARGKQFDLNMIAEREFSKEDREQLAQLLGCSVCTFGELPYSSKKAVKKADKKARKLNERRSKDN